MSGPIIWGGTGGIGKLIPSTSAGVIQTDASGNLSTTTISSGGMAGLDPVAYTPTFVGGGTIASSTVTYSRVGKWMIIKGQVVIGSPTGTPFQFSMPSGFSIDYTSAGFPAGKTTGAGLSATPNSTSTIFASGGAALVVFADGTDAANLYFAAGGDANPGTAYAKVAINSFTPANNTLDFTAQVPIVGWTSGSAAAFNVGARYYASATAVSGSLATVVWTTQDYDTNSAMSSGTYTCPIAGKMQINVSLAIAATFTLNNSVDVQIQKNGTVVAEQQVYAAAAVTNLVVSLSDLINVSISDTIRVQVSSSGTSPSIVSSNSKNYISLKIL